MFFIFIFLIGCFFGSFLNLLIDRLPKGENVISGRSHCDSCGKTLKAIDLIPVVSFIWIRGKCRYCRTSLSYFYPFIEIFTGFVFLFNYLWVTAHLFNFGPEFYLTLLYFLVISSGLIVIFFADLRYGIIPNQVLAVLLVVVSLYQAFFMRQDLPINILSAIISFAFFMALVLLTKGRGMGFGDVKFSFILGLILGFPGFILGLYTAFLTGAVASIILVLWGKKRLRRDTIAFGPFLVIGVFVALFLGDILIPRLLPFLVP